jgi:hypothetical protein
MLHHGAGRDRQRGQILILFTLVVIVIFGFTAIVIDLGMLRNNRQSLANALDAGALAGGTLLPVDGAGGTGPAAVAAITARINREIQATYPGLRTPQDYQIAYRCLIGTDGSGQPAIARDIPAVCNPRNALGHAPVASDFIGAGKTRSSICDPARGDRCNAVVINGAVTNAFTFGRAVGVNQGSTGVVVSAACNGPCGEPPFAPLDVAVIIDRTGSMAGDEANLRNATRTILATYDPNTQHIALGALGPSSLNATCNGTPAGRIGIPLEILDDPGPQPPNLEQDTSSSTTNNSLAIARPGNANLAGQLLVAGIAVDNATTSINAPTGWTQIRRTDHGTNGANVAVISYYKVATAAEPSSYTWTFGANRRAAGGIMRYSGAATSNPIVASSGNTGNNDDLRASSITAVNDTALVAFYGSDSNTDIDVEDMDGEAFEAGPGGSGPTIAGQYDEDGSGGTGVRDAQADDDAPWAAQLIGIAPGPYTPVVQEYGTDVDADIDKWMLQGLTGRSGPFGAPDVDEAYSTGGTINNSSRLARVIDCVTDEDNLSGTGTNLATPMRMATEWLRDNARPGVKQGIIFESDGTPNYNGESGDPLNYRCDTAIQAAQEAKDAGIEVFTIGFDIAGERCPESSKLATTAMAEMATGPILNGTNCNTAENQDGDHFFCEPGGSDLSAVFQAAAVQLAGIRSHLVAIYPAPYVTSIGPASGNAAGGNTITITGSGFTGATRVQFGGAPSTSFTVASDTSITARVPPGSSGQTVHVRVTSPGGTSPTVTGDQYRYN